jgi:hypothetical protein
MHGLVKQQVPTRVWARTSPCISGSWWYGSCSFVGVHELKDSAGGPHLLLLLACAGREPGSTSIKESASMYCEVARAIRMVHVGSAGSDPASTMIREDIIPVLDYLRRTVCLQVDTCYDCTTMMS